MWAEELIQKLQEMVNTYGDHLVVLNDEQYTCVDDVVHRNGKLFIIKTALDDEL